MRSIKRKCFSKQHIQIKENALDVLVPKAKHKNFFKKVLRGIANIVHRNVAPLA